MTEVPPGVLYLLDMAGRTLAQQAQRLAELASQVQDQARRIAELEHQLGDRP